MSDGKLLGGEVNDLQGLITPSEGAIVSRTLVKGRGGTITLFAFDEGQEVSEHTAPFDALVQVLEGRAEVTISGEPREVAAGQVLLMPANAPHALKALAPYKMLLTMLKEPSGK